MRTSPHQGGATLVEVLVVVAVIAALIALVFPAIQSAREASRRMQCASNLRQIAIGAQNYCDMFGVFPINYLPSRNPRPNWNDNSGFKHWSWLSRTLPFLEQQALYQTLNVGGNTLRQSERGIAAQVVLFLCPSDDYSHRGPRTDGDNLGTPPLAAPLPLGHTNYKGVSGANWNWGDDRWNSVASTIDGSRDGLKSGDGMFYRSDFLTPRRLSSVSDGASSTFMIGEDLPRMNTHCSWPYANHSQGTCAIPPNARRPDGQHFEPDDWHNVYSFRSHHPYCLHFAFVDGSVKPVSNSVDSRVYRSCATIQGGDSTDAP